ncbi:hypothetical protein PBY51_019239 [Eleginops maclovinus]|uniref:Uncharacterized protein n=1 Tax=Eleginops maclovinus TaxID=56733 RepID=A0AAN7YAA2_ELEMC|nr:hypothetical protein PBY51_019239 [Eleginops maclovinus]
MYCGPDDLHQRSITKVPSVLVSSSAVKSSGRIHHGVMPASSASSGLLPFAQRKDNIFTAKQKYDSEGTGVH